MVRAVADTHTTIWYVYNDLRLSAPARSFIEQTATAGHQIGISAITFAEIVYLVEKGRILPDVFDRVTDALDRSDSVFVELPYTRKVAGTMRSIARTAVPDMPDRIIAATALHAGVPVISRDYRIRVSLVATIW